MEKVVSNDKLSQENSGQILEVLVDFVGLDDLPREYRGECVVSKET